MARPMRSSARASGRFSNREIVGCELLPPILAGFRRHHPGITLELALNNHNEDLLRRDATVLRLVAGIAERRIPGVGRMGIRELAEELITGMTQELDYLRAAAMADRLRKALTAEGIVINDGKDGTTTWTVSGG